MLTYTSTCFTHSSWLCQWPHYVSPRVANEGVIGKAHLENRCHQLSTALRVVVIFIWMHQYNYLASPTQSIKRARFNRANLAMVRRVSFSPVLV